MGEPGAFGRFSENGLLPRMSDNEVHWLRPDFRESAEPLRAAVVWAADIASQGHLVWPARQGEHLAPPPPEHVLDRLTRQELSGASPEIDAELMLHPEAGTVALVGAFPRCDLCASVGVDVPARYDGPTSAEPRALWGNLCGTHYDECSTGRLGVGEGQFLMLRSEISADVLRALDVARDFWRQRRDELP